MGPRWQDAPKPFRLIVCRLLLIHLAQTWGDKDAGAEATGEVERGLGDALGRELVGHSRPIQ